MATPVADRTVASVAYDYAQTVNGAKDLMFKPVKAILDIAHFNGRQSRISENVRNLADDAGSALDFTEVFPKLYDAIGKVFTFIQAPGFFNLGELSAKIARFASCVFKCGAFLAKKGAAMWDAGILKGWADRFSTIQFGWGTFKAVSDLSSDAVVSVEEKTLSVIKLVFNASILTLSAAASMLTPFGLLFTSCTALASSISMEFYGKLNGLD